MPDGHKGSNCPLHVFYASNHRQMIGWIPTKIMTGFLQVIGLGQSQMPVFIKSALHSIPTRGGTTLGAPPGAPMIPKAQWRSSSGITEETKTPKPTSTPVSQPLLGPQLGA